MTKRLFVLITIMASLIFVNTSISYADDVLEIPDSAQKIFVDDSKHVKYKISNGAYLSSGTQELVAPVIVDEKIISKSKEEVSGVTNYVTFLNEVKDIENDNVINNLDVFGFIVGKKVFANSTTGSKWDSTIGVKISTTINWLKSGTTKKITSVSGNYTIGDQSIRVTSSNISINQAGLGGYSAKYALGTSNSWSRSVSFPYEQQGATVGGAVYTVNLIRNSSTWNVVLNNTAWSFG